jgi:hypothetical protein
MCSSAYGARNMTNTTILNSSPILVEHMHAIAVACKHFGAFVASTMQHCGCALPGASVRLTWLLKHTRSELHTLLPHTVLPKGRHLPCTHA